MQLQFCLRCRNGLRGVASSVHASKILRRHLWINRCGLKIQWESHSAEATALHTQSAEWPHVSSGTSRLRRGANGTASHPPALAQTGLWPLDITPSIPLPSLAPGSQEAPPTLLSLCATVGLVSPRSHMSCRTTGVGKLRIVSHQCWLLGAT